MYPQFHTKSLFVSDESTSNTLLKANLKTVPLSKCNSTVVDYVARMVSSPFKSGLDQSYYCAVDADGVSDTCDVDNGTPLQIVRRYFELSTVVGVISAALPCVQSNDHFPGIFTRVAFFIDWIESYVWPNSEIATPLMNLPVLCYDTPYCPDDELPVLG